MTRKRAFAIGLALACVAVALTVYFEPSYRVRGWIWSEAVFDCKPTSYWRGEIDEWARQFPSQEEAVRVMTIDPLKISPSGPQEVVIEFSGLVPQPTLWDRVTGMFRRSSTYELDGPLVPAVLLVNDETDGVLCDLERVTKYQPFVEQARKNAAIMRQSTRR